MRIAHVATLLSPDGAFGGPVRVATNQLNELQRMGHEVCLYAAHSGYDAVPTLLDGVPVRAFKAKRVIPRTGFAGITSTGVLTNLTSELTTYDIVHVHLARDLVTLPAAVITLAKKRPLVLQTHGMIDPSNHPLARPLDAVWTRRVLRAADRLLYLTEWERDSLLAVAGSRIKLARLVNGVPLPEASGLTSAGAIDVLFLGRLQAVKRPEVFVRAATRLAHEFPDATFSLVGPDEGEGRAVRSLIDASGAPDRIRWEGPLAPGLTLERMYRSHVFALPSGHDTFPMSVLEAASIGIPSAMTHGCGLASPVRRYGAGVVTDQSEDAFEDGLRQLLVGPAQRASMGSRARAMVEEEFSMEHVVTSLLSIYEDAIRLKGRPSLLPGGSLEPC